MSQSSAVTEHDKERARDVLERVTKAVRGLCVGKEEVRSRLENVVMDHLAHLREEDFPSGLQGKFREIMEQSTKYDASDLYEGPIPSTMRRIRRSTGAKIACDIWELFAELMEMIDRPIMA